jgi:sulfate transport system permease protein
MTDTAISRARPRQFPGSRLALRVGVLGYLAVLLFVPLVLICYRTFEHGVGQVWDVLSSPPAVHALLLSLAIAAIAVPVNAVFGVGTGWLIARRKMPLRCLVNAVIDLPFAMSPVIIGLAVYALYGAQGWFGPWLIAHGVQFLFSWKAMVVATALVCLPFVVREVVPVLEELGDEQEQAAAVLGASPWQSFLRVTIPSVRWAIVYGVVLSAARALGEFGAVSIVAGHVSGAGATQTLPLYVQDQFSSYDNPIAAYSAGFLLAVISVLILVVMTLLSRQRAGRDSQ